MNRAQSKEQTRILVEALHRQVRASGWTQSEIERRAGLTSGYLSQLLAKNLDLKLSHLLAVLRCLGTEPCEFFRPADRATAAEGATTSSTRHASLQALRTELQGLSEQGFPSLASLRHRVARCERLTAQLCPDAHPLKSPAESTQPRAGRESRFATPMPETPPSEAPPSEAPPSEASKSAASQSAGPRSEASPSEAPLTETSAQGTPSPAQPRSSTPTR